MLSHLLAASLTNARRKLYSWFHQPIDTMSDFNPWETITDRSLSQQIQLVLHLFSTAVSASPSPVVVLDRLQVVSIWLNKSSGSLEHEFMIIETKDSEDKKMRLFIIDRITRQPHTQPASENPLSLLINPRAITATNDFRVFYKRLVKSFQTQFFHHHAQYPPFLRWRKDSLPHPHPHPHTSGSSLLLHFRLLNFQLATPYHCPQLKHLKRFLILSIKVARWKPLIGF